MMRSNIFEEFVKIAKAKGLISEAQSAEHTEKDFHETNPRMDSLSIEQIGKLYNTKPSLPKDMEYEHNIMEDAHPESLVLMPAHDKLNGLVENNIEGQNIRMRIVMKTPDGQLTHRKYAEQQLLLSLVRVGNDLDNRNQDELRKLADVCLLQASGKQFKKVAFLPIVGAIAAALGALYFKQHVRFHSDGFEVDYQKAMKEINDLLVSNSNWGVGYAYTPAFIQVVGKLQEELTKLHTAVQQIVPVLERMETPGNGVELAKLSQEPETQEVAQSLTDFEAVVKEVYPYINGIITDFGNEDFKQRAIAQKGWMSSLVDTTEVLHGGAGLIADDFDDVKHALQTLKVDIENIVRGLQTAGTIKQKAAQQLESSQAEESQLFSRPPAETGKPEGEIGSLEEAGEGLLGG